MGIWGYGIVLVYLHFVSQFGALQNRLFEREHLEPKRGKTQAPVVKLCEYFHTWTWRQDYERLQLYVLVWVSLGT